MSQIGSAFPCDTISGWQSGPENWNDTEKIIMAPAQGWHTQIEKCNQFFCMTRGAQYMQLARCCCQHFCMQTCIMQRPNIHDLNSSKIQSDPNADTDPENLVDTSMFVWHADMQM